MSPCAQGVPRRGEHKYDDLHRRQLTALCECKRTRGGRRVGRVELVLIGTMAAFDLSIRLGVSGREVSRSPGLVTPRTERSVCRCPVKMSCYLFRENVLTRCGVE